jgi:hypothetical protein
MLKLDEARQIAEDAYIFGYPIISMEVTRKRSTAVNQFSHFTKLPNARFNAVASMSVDTLFLSLWLDLSKEPLILSVSEIDNGLRNR